jgi:hypothetical protein
MRVTKGNCSPFVPFRSPGQNSSRKGTGTYPLSIEGVVPLFRSTDAGLFVTDIGILFKPIGTSLD